MTTSVSSLTLRVMNGVVYLGGAAAALHLKSRAEELVGSWKWHGVSWGLVARASQVLSEWVFVYMDTAMSRSSMPRPQGRVKAFLRCCSEGWRRQKMPAGAFSPTDGYDSKTLTETTPMEINLPCFLFLCVHNNLASLFICVKSYFLFNCIQQTLGASWVLQLHRRAQTPRPQLFCVFPSFPFYSVMEAWVQIPFQPFCL